MKLNDAIDLFTHAFERGRIATGYVVAGAPRGGAGQFVEQALQLLFCESERKPCGSCVGCRGIREHTHPDLAWIEPQKKSRLISIAQIREVQKKIYQTSFSGGWKACVIVGADRLGASASNAFLKVLEEPAGQSMFFLLTDSPQFLLATINSRCQRIRVSGDAQVLLPEWETTLLGILEDAGRQDPISSFALSDRFKALLKSVREAAYSEITEDAEEETLMEENSTLDARASARYREMRSALIRTMLLWYRDLLLLASEGDACFVLKQERMETLRRKATGLSYRDALKNVEVVERLNRQMEKSLPEGPLLSFAFGQLA